MYDSWTCLTVEKGPGMLTDGIRAALKRAACTLHRRKRDKMLFESEECDGIIETAWDSHLVGALSGILFRTQLTSEDGDFQVNFLLNTGDLERGALLLGDDTEGSEDGVWTNHPERFPVEALYQFYDLSSRGSLS